MKRYLFISICVILLGACSDLSLSLFSPDYVNDTPKNASVENALKRALQISQIKWTPIKDVPNNSGFYYSGIQIKGMPYSSVKELDKFVGMEVSFKTFMTAVHNPRSVLYTENISKTPYHGKNGATYYGVVCSSTVDYALGLSINYVTASIDTLSLFTKVQRQTPEDIELCDVLLSPGHVVMIYNIARSTTDSTIKEISILESAGTSTRIHTYKLKEFERRWNDDGWVLYRYNELDKDIPYEPSPFVPVMGESIEQYKYNNIICPSRGDGAVFREGEEVVINIFNKSFINLDLYRDNVLIDSRRTSSLDVSYVNLEYGSYTIIASDDRGNKADEIHFDVVDTNVKLENLGEEVRVYFNSNYGLPEYVKLCNEYGGMVAIRPLTEEEIIAGVVNLPIQTAKARNSYCKVFFSTPNGKVTNQPIKIKGQ